MLAIFARVQDNPATIFVGGNPVRLLLIIEGNPRHLTYVTEIGDVVGRKGVRGKQCLYPVMADSQRNGAPLSIKRLHVSNCWLVCGNAVQLVQAARKRVDENGLSISE